MKTKFCQENSTEPYEGCAQKNEGEKEIHALIPYLYIVIFEKIDIKIPIKIIVRSDMKWHSNT